MSIQHAILGMLSFRPLTGYDLKKAMQGSPFMYWSGNNNQVYKALMELKGEGYLTSEDVHQSGGPSKKVYTITGAGLDELARWSLSPPEAPEMRKPFLVQLAWSWQLGNDELTDLLARYRREVEGQVRIDRGRAASGRLSPGRTDRERAIWELIYENVEDSYAAELKWIDMVVEAVAGSEPAAGRLDETIEGETEMNYTVIEKNGGKYLLLEGEGRRVEAERDAIDLISICAESGTNLLMISSERLSDDFFRLRTGLAGAILQKFTQYGVRLAVVLGETHLQGKFVDFLAESNRGQVFNAYLGREEAERWLMGIK